MNVLLRIAEPPSTVRFKDCSFAWVRGLYSTEPLLRKAAHAAGFMGKSAGSASTKNAAPAPSGIAGGAAIADRLAAVGARIAAAARAAGRDPAAVALVAVSKTMPEAAVEAALA